MARPGDPAAVRKAATRLVGAPVKWGGDSPAGFDHAGLAQYVYRQLGIELPRQSWNQMQVGAQVDVGQLRPGDLVFLSADENTGVPDSTAVYVGSGQMVHADHGSGKVQVASLATGHYLSRFVTARRHPALAYPGDTAAQITPAREQA